MIVSEGYSNIKPFIILGNQLQKFREESKESVAEVSGAIEIDEAKLTRFEQGNERPSEDILLLLITHFSVSDDEALRLWELAGYDQSRNDSRSDYDSSSTRQLVMVMTTDPRIIYSDSVQVIANPNGVVMNFLQAPDGMYSSQTVSRVGMSREQAYKVVSVLSEALERSSKLKIPKRLPQPKSKAKKNPNSK